MSTSIPNPRHLQVLLQVAHCGSASMAARAAHLSQPAVTQIIARMEEEFATELFVRNARGMVATEAGEICIRRIRRALERLHEGLEGGAGPGGGATGRTGTSTQLDALVAIVGQRSVAEAARVTGISKPTLHRAARELERTLGVALFERTSFGVRPTRAACQLALSVRLAGAELTQARAEISARAGQDRGRTVIGAMPLARSFLVPAAILEFTGYHPKHGVQILEGPYEKMLEALREGTADMLVGALRDPAPAGDVVQKHLFEDPLALVVRAGHPLTTRARPTAADFASFAWIAPHPGSPLRGRFETFLRSAGVRPSVAHIECSSLIAARALLLGSDRVLLLSAHQIQHEITMGQLAALPLPGGRITRAIGLTVRSNWHPTAAQAQLLEVLRRHARRLPG